MLKRTEGIVLKTTVFAEADLIVTYLTPDFGLIQTFAKSPRKTKSRFGSSLEPLTYSKISFWGKEDSRLPRLTQSDIIEPFAVIREKLDTFMEAAGMLSITISLTPEGEPGKKVFMLLLNTLRLIEKNASNSLNTLSTMYKVRFLDCSGYTPSMSACARCGGKSPSFVLLEGRLLCDSCGRFIHEPVRISQGGINLYESLRTWEMDKVPRIKPTRAMLGEIQAFINGHLRYIIKKVE